MTNTSNKKITRRDAIKFLGAAAGASMLANLPAKWSKPQLKGGSLPAHAQTSNCVTLTLELRSATGSPIIYMVQTAETLQPSSQVGANHTYVLGNSFTPPVNYQAIWTCRSGCLQLVLNYGASSAFTWGVRVSGPNPSYIEYSDTTDLLINLETGIFVTGYADPTAVGCAWVRGG